MVWLIVVFWKHIGTHQVHIFYSLSCHIGNGVLSTSDLQKTVERALCEEGSWCKFAVDLVAQVPYAKQDGDKTFDAWADDVLDIFYRTYWPTWRRGYDSWDDDDLKWAFENGYL